ncbi:MAG: DUF1987 domain-containing protein [Bacteroidota bacterium]|nr:DUF1987 domain-containing protein [Bacteroidota bacterium]
MKESFLIKETFETPKITWNSEKMILEIKGAFINTNANEFLEPVFECISSFTKPTQIFLALDFFNMRSIKTLLVFFKEVKKIKHSSVNVSVYWFYEKNDDDLFEAGQDLQELINLNFKLIPTNSIDLFHSSVCYEQTNHELTNSLLTFAEIKPVFQKSNFEGLKLQQYPETAVVSIVIDSEYFPYHFVYSGSLICKRVLKSPFVFAHKEFKAIFQTLFLMN